MTSDVRFLMPGSWQHLPVADPQASARVIRRVVAERAGRGDDRAALRAGLRQQFEAAATRARRAGGVAMWLCTEITAGVPLPATLTLYDPALTIPRHAEAGAQRAALHGLLGAADGGVAEQDLTVAGRGAVRRARIVRGAVDASPDSREVVTVEVDYWTLQPDGRHVLLLSFACGMPRLAGRLTELFDLIVVTLRWPAEAGSQRERAASAAS